MQKTQYKQHFRLVSLGLSGIVFICLGIFFLFYEQGLSNNSYVIEMRSAYSGFHISLGIFMCYCAFQKKNTKPALLLLTLSLFFLAACRLLVIFLSHTVLTSLLLLQVTIEISGALIGYILYKRSFSAHA